MKIVIIEDEKAAIRNLRAILSEVSEETEVIATLESISESIDWFKTNGMPELIFMDIHLADGSAFEIFEFIHITAPVIFTTAYDEYALKAFKVNSIDYLLKPIGQKEIKNAFNKLELLQNRPEPGVQDLSGLIKAFRNRESYQSHFLIPVKGDKLLPLAADQIACFTIEDGMVKAVTNSHHKYTFPYTLDELGVLLNPADFFRANRQYIIARRAIQDIDLWFNGRLSINLTVSVKEKILVSKARVTEFKEWLTGNR